MTERQTDRQTDRKKEKEKKEKKKERKSAIDFLMAFIGDDRFIVKCCSLMLQHTASQNPFC